MPGLGVDFQPGLQQSFIAERGVQMLHEIGVLCTCQVEDTYAGVKKDGKDRRREPFCPRCGGDAKLYRDGSLIVGIATSIRQQRNIIDAGVAQPGDMLFSPDMGSAAGSCETDGGRVIAVGDKLIATWDQPLDDGQVIIRGAGTTGENATLNTNLEDTEDRLWYEPLRSIWCEDEEGIVYTANADFILGPGRIIKWVGNRPPLGRRYTIKYTAFFEWIVFAPAQERYDRDALNLGPLVFLRKRHIAFINDNPKIVETDRISLQSRVSC